MALTAHPARFQPAGRLVDVGGRRLHLICVGEGAVFEVLAQAVR